MSSVIGSRCSRAVVGTVVVGAVGALAPPVKAEVLEFALRAGASVPTEGHEYQPAAAPSGGLTALVRLGEHVAAGLLVDMLWLAWHSPPGGDGRFDGPLEFPDDGTRSTLFALEGRFYPLARDPVDTTPLLPFVEVGLGYVSVSMPNNLDCRSGSGVSGQLAFGVDWQVASDSRLGLTAAARPLRSARACYPDDEPPTVALAVSGQLAFTTLWSAK